MDDTRPDAGPLERSASRLDPGRIITLTLLVLAPLIAIWTFWHAQQAFFLLFAGILWAALLDACVRGLTGHAGMQRNHAVYLVIAATLAIVAALFWFAGSYIWSQANELYGALSEQLQDIGTFIENVTGESVAENRPMSVLRELSSFFGSGNGESGGAFSLAASTLGSLGNALIIYFVGVFLLVEPDLYKRGLVRLFPKRHREGVDHAMHEAGETLRSWLTGKLLSMSIIFAMTWIGLMLLGYPFAFALGLLAGLLAFVPNIGPILTYIPIALLGLSEGLTTVALGLAVYAVAQTVESFLVTPLIQKRMVSLPPALIFFAQVLGGILFGLWGVALATPLAAILRLWVEKHYVEERLEAKPA